MARVSIVSSLALFAASVLAIPVVDAAPASPSKPKSMVRKKGDMMASLKKADIVPNLLTQQQYARLKHDPKLVKAAVDIAIAGQQLDTDSSSAVEQLSRKPTLKNAARLQRITVVAGLGLPTQASKSGVSARRIIEMVAVFDMIDDGQASKVDLSDAHVWERVRKHGADAVIGDRIRERFKIPAQLTAGLSARQLMAGVRLAQQTGRGGKKFWKGYASRVRGSNGGSGGSGGSQSGQAGMPRQSEMRQDTRSAQEGRQGERGRGGPAPGGESLGGDVWTLKITSVGKDTDGAPRIEFTVTSSDGRTEQRVAFVSGDGSTNVEDKNGNLIDWYGPGTSNVTSWKAGDTFTVANDNHIVMTDADAGPANGENNNNPNGGEGSGTGDGGDSKNNANGSDSNEGDSTGDDPNKGDGQGTGCTEQETGCNNGNGEGDEEEKPPEEKPAEESTPNPMADDPWAGPPLWMMVREALGRGERMRDEKRIRGKKTGGVIDPSPTGDREDLALPFLVTHLDARLFVEGVVRGRGGRHTDPSPLDDGDLPNTSGGVTPAHTGAAVDRPSKKKAPMTPYDIPKQPPGPPGGARSKVR